jgi:hypothetical protein
MAASLPAPRADPQFTVTLCPLASHTGHADHQSSQPHPRRFAIAAITSAALTGLLGCGTTGLGGAAGVVIGLVAGGVAGWIAATRAAHA